MRFILASSSPRRRELLASLRITFEVLKPQIDEAQHPDEDPYDYVKRLSVEKAQAIAERINTDAMILAADTIVLAADTIGMEESGGDILGKPIDADDARATLKRLRGKAHIVCTAFTLLRLGTAPQQITEAVNTIVYMRDYTDDEIETYIATGDPFDKAGSYAIQHTGFAPVERIEGDYNNVVGLPIEAVKAALQQMNYPI